MSSDPSFFVRLLEPLRRRVAMLVRRAVIDVVKDENPVQAIQLKLFKNEIRQGVERIQEYGFTSVPLPEGQAVEICVDGEPGHGLVIATDDRRYRPRNLAPGDVMLYTNKNPEAAHHIHFDAATRTITIRARAIRIEADEGIDIAAGANVNITGAEIHLND
ncbi:MAG: phage baseplate assembly protein V [Planctomycetota bacterium]|jgi:phage baseplate assembly protein V|nr:phage baseplate assembly protein V [Planctomycetota bacterium]